MKKEDLADETDIFSWDFLQMTQWQLRLYCHLYHSKGKKNLFDENFIQQIWKTNAAWGVTTMLGCHCWTVSSFLLQSVLGFCSQAAEGQLLRLRYRSRSWGGSGVCWESSLTLSMCVCVTLETHPVLWSSPLSQHQSRHTESRRTSQGPLARTRVYACDACRCTSTCTQRHASMSW